MLGYWKFRTKTGPVQEEGWEVQTGTTKWNGRVCGEQAAAALAPGQPIVNTAESDELDYSQDLFN